MTIAIRGESAYSSREVQAEMVSIHMAPMQGLTDHFFREVYFNHFPGVDFTYSPFMILEKGGLRSRDARELEAGAKEGDRFTPQIAAAGAGEAERLTRLLVEQGVRRVNLNLGCPFPMLTKRRRGAGALPHPEQVADTIQAIYSVNADLRVSVKTRLGLESPRELDALVPIFNRYPLDAVIIHPRIGTEKYRGIPAWDELGVQGPKLTAQVIANGDIDTVDRGAHLLETFPFVSGIMMGRGLLRDPFLPARMKHIPLGDAEPVILRSFHDGLYAVHGKRLQSPDHLLSRMRELWRYFADSFPNPPKAYKSIKKSRTPAHYEDAVNRLFEELGKQQKEDEAAPLHLS